MTGLPAQRGRTALTLLVCLGAIALSMTDSIGATFAVPVMSNTAIAIGLERTELQWVITAFAVPYAALLPTAGRVADLVGHRRLLVLGLGVFTAGAVLAITVTAFPLLLVARALQGVGTAAMVPSSLALLLSTFPDERRAAAIGAWSAAPGLSGALMHAAGGWLGEGLGWRSYFMPSAIVGSLLLCCALALPHTKRLAGRLPDPFGTVLLMGSLSVIVWAIVQSPNWGWSAQLAAALGAGLVLLLAAVWRSAHHPVPAIELALWRTPMFALAGLLSVLYGLIAFPMLVMAPMYLRDMWPDDPALLGAGLAPISLGVLVSGLISGQLTKKHGPRPVIYTGALLVTVACVWLITQGMQDGPPRLLEVWLPSSAVFGLGLGALSTAISAAAALSGGPERYAAAGGASQSARQVGAALGVACAAVLMDNPIVSGPMPGYSSSVLTCLAMAAVAGVLGLFLAPSRVKKAPQPEPKPRREPEPAEPAERVVPVLVRRETPPRRPAPEPPSPPTPPSQPQVPVKSLIALYEAAGRVAEAADTVLSQHAINEQAQHKSPQNPPSRHRAHTS
ncbi:MFS transporter [Acrocarpospora phusangensis]|uniref:MFS transporter n=1 Tax=Acrocarpospora phusangensis TaxID=1070424 RepID=A0A919UM06_9ACTN|nr:MFS transporter [Acrocarpospora phusangensis]GIH26509.1 MFS transporter [Acrocarpospora phusangensis]